MQTLLYFSLYRAEAIYLTRFWKLKNSFSVIWDGECWRLLKVGFTVINSTNPTLQHKILVLVILISEEKNGPDDSKCIENGSNRAPHTSLGDDGDAKVIKKIIGKVKKYCLLKIHVNNKIFHSQPSCLKIFYWMPSRKVHDLLLVKLLLNEIITDASAFVSMF